MNKYKMSEYLHVCADEELLPGRSILYSTRTGTSFEISNDHLTSLQKDEWQSVPLKTLGKLIELEAIVPADEDELEHVLQFNKANVKDEDVVKLSFTIQPSANCQLGCHYCGQNHVKKVLTDETGELIYARVKEKVEAYKGTLQQLYINWYGGEPLTGLSSLKKLSSRLIALARQHNLDYSAFIVTNGLSLKPSLFEELVRDHYIMGYQITVDGTADFHDKRRMLKTKGPSFDIIMNNIEEIVHGDFYGNSKADIIIRCNVDAENRENVMELIEMLHQKAILPKVAFYVSPIHDWGGNMATQINGIKKDDFAQFEIEVLMTLLNYGAKAGKKSKLIPGRKTYTCMVVSETSEVLDAYGNVSTCWEVPYTPVYEGSMYVSGNLHTETVSTVQAPMRQWFDEIPNAEHWCKTCKFLPVCGGACPKSWYEGKPACPSFKYNINERLFLNKMMVQQPQA